MGSTVIHPSIHPSARARRLTAVAMQWCGPMLIDALRAASDQPLGSRPKPAMMTPSSSLHILTVAKESARIRQVNARTEYYQSVGRASSSRSSRTISQGPATLNWKTFPLCLRDHSKGVFDDERGSLRAHTTIQTGRQTGGFSIPPIHGAPVAKPRGGPSALSLGDCWGPCKKRSNQHPHPSNGHEQPCLFTLPTCTYRRV